MIDQMNLPTSTMEGFRQQLLNPNIEFQLPNQTNEIPPEMRDQIMKVQKNFVLSFVSDSTGCGHIRNVFPMTFLNSEFGKSGRFNLVLSPIPILQPEILTRTRTIYFQRWMAPDQIRLVQHYKQLQQKLRFRMVYDIDDFIWKGDDEGEHIPPYNFGSEGIGDDVRKASVEIMNMMDVVCVSTDFLGDYIKNKLGVKSQIVTLPNAVPKYFWGPDVRKPITEKIKVPRVIYSGSPTHYHNGKHLLGDWGNAWVDWVIKNVKDKKIIFICMGGTPFFFEGIKDHPNFRVVNWVNSYLYHLPIKEENPDFGVAPLVPNYFNYSKSDIKHIEYCSRGILSIGTVFTNGKPSPYDNNFVKVPDTITVDQIDELFKEYTEPDRYNDIIQKQYKMMEDTGRYLEHPLYVRRLLNIF